MSDTLRPVSVQKVAAILRKAGVQFSRPSNPSGIRGQTQDTYGAKVKSTPDGVLVRYHQPAYTTLPHIRKVVDLYRDALTAANVVFMEDDGELICTGIKE